MASLTFDEIVEKSLAGSNDLKDDVEGFCRDGNLTPDAFSNMFARLIAEGYLAGRFSWESGDAAMNAIYPVMLDCPKLPEFAWAIFIAFDDGEWHPRSVHLTSDEVTRPIIRTLIDGFPLPEPS